MSFKSRLIDYCEKTAKLDCYDCPLKEPCDKVTRDLIPSKWSDDKFDEMQNNSWEYLRSMSQKMSEISKLMLDVSKDDVAEIKERWLI